VERGLRLQCRQASRLWEGGRREMCDGIHVDALGKAQGRGLVRGEMLRLF